MGCEVCVRSADEFWAGLPLSARGCAGGGAVGPERRRHSDWRSDVRRGGPVDWRGTQSAGAAGRSIVAWRDGCVSEGGPAEELSEINHGDDACAVLVLQRAGAAVWIWDSNYRRESELSGRDRVVTLAGSEGD